jgi:N-acetylmuramoyl-L-alanine amidase
MKRHINQVIVHCSASPNGTTAEDIERWHRDRGFNGCGYHYVIESTGIVRYKRLLETKGAHTKGQNSNSIGICLVGGTDSAGTYNPFNQDQIDSLNDLLHCINDTFERPLEIRPHNYYSNKLCPDLLLSDILDKEFLPYLKEKESINEEIRRHYKGIEPGNDTN